MTTTTDAYRQERCRKLCLNLSHRFAEFDWDHRLRCMPDISDSFWCIYNELDEVMHEYMEGSKDWDSVLIVARDLYCFAAPSK